VSMLSPLPRRSSWVVDFARYPSHVRVPDDRDHQFPAIVITHSRAS
jgi:hypothetical protein